MADEAVVFVSCPQKESEGIANALVQERLAACVSILPKVTSVYRWQSEIHRDEESLLVIKTNKSHWQHLNKRIKELHSYEVPEIILLPIELGHTPYLEWLNQELSGKTAVGKAAIE